mgnify:CR=1 FL=1
MLPLIEVLNRPRADNGDVAKNMPREHKEFMRVELLRVEDVFDLTNQGLVCAPFFQPSPQGPYKDFSAVVTVQPPDRPAFDVDASFNLTHFKILDVEAPVE